MSDKIYLGLRLADLDIGEPSKPISKVILNVDGANSYSAGDDTGTVIEQDCPWATQEMADHVLKKLQGFVYRPYSGTDALLDPAAELGDTLSVGGTGGILAQMGRKLDHLCAASVAAPGTDEIEDEYPYKTKQRKQTDRTLAKAYSRISKTSEEILLEVGRLDGELGQTLRVAADGVTITNAEGDTLTIDGGQIDATKIKTEDLDASKINADDLVLTGTITWKDLSSDAQSSITDAQDAADNAQSTADSAKSTADSASTAAGKAYDLASNAYTTATAPRPGCT